MQAGTASRPPHPPHATRPCTPRPAQYERAIGIYEAVAASSLDNNLLKWSVKEYLQRSLLCQMAAGDEEAFGKVSAGGPVLAAGAWEEGQGEGWGDEAKG